MDKYIERIVLRSRDVNLHRNLRTSRLFELIQEVSIRHTEELGAGRLATLDRGLLWVVTLQRAEIIHMPSYDDEIVVETWPGTTMHVMFPRYYRILDNTGNVLINASAIWMLVDSETRQFAFPDKYGISINGVKTGNEIAIPSTPESLELSHSFDFKVPFSYVDLNGHMNNARYFDLVEDNITEAVNGNTPKFIATEYLSEIRLNDNVTVSWANIDNKYCFTGTGKKNYFKLYIEYGK